jgi:16S rRNA processing protein RimM
LFVGRLGRAVGLKGEIEVAVESDAPDRFAVGSTLTLRDDGRTLTVRSMRTHRDRTIVTFDEVGDRNAAESLKGADLMIDASEARPLGEAEFWDHDLIGCEVVTTGDEIVGDVTEVLHAGANEVLVVRAQSGAEHLIPLIADVVRDVRPRERITIEPMPGLLE